MNLSVERGLGLTARYALQPNTQGFCGDNDSQKVLRDFLTRHLHEDLVFQTLDSHGFPHLNSFLDAIAEISGRDKFDEAIVESYWLGNDLTKAVGTKTKNVLVSQYHYHMFPEFSGNLAKLLPEDIYLTHLSQVALIAAGGETEPRKTELINHCMIAFATVLSVDQTSALVNRETLEKDRSGKYHIVMKKQSVHLDPDLTLSVEAGDQVSLHLGFIAGILTDTQAKSLQFWTHKVISFI